MVGVSVKFETAQFARYLNRVQRKQLPFATAKSLTDTAFDARKHVVDVSWPRAVTVRNRRFMGAAMRVEKATKRTLTARLFDKLGRASVGLHATGGTKRPRGRSIAVPTKHVNRTGSGRVRKSQTPRAVLSSSKGFKTRLRSGDEAILQRQGGKKSRRVKVLYTLHPSARIRRRFPFERDVERVVRRRYPQHFIRNMRRALATAR